MRKLVAVFIIAVIVIALTIFLFTRLNHRSAIAPPPTTAPTTRTAATRSTAPAAPENYVQLIRAKYPKVAATQPLGIPVDLDDAGHFVLRSPVYLCPRGDLWLTYPDAKPVQEVLFDPTSEQTHLVRERVAFVHWFLDRRGHVQARVVVKSDKGFDWIDAGAQRAVEPKRAYRWDRALAWNDRVIVPSDRGVSIFDFSNAAPREIYHELIDAKTSQNFSEPEFLLDTRGLLAWAPWVEKKSGSRGAARFLDDKWTPLGPDQGWPEKIIHLVPLLDGSIMQIASGKGENVELALSTLERANVDEKTMVDLVTDLADSDREKREAAHAALTRYGQGVWPILEKLKDQQPLEAQIRIGQLLAEKTQPTLGGMKLVDPKLRRVARLHDGGVIFFAGSGVSMTDEQEHEKIITPAWISVRPGRAIELLDDDLVRDADPDKQHFAAFGDEWIVSDTTRGPRRLLGNHVDALLRPDEVAFDQLIGIDARGRWLFRKSSGGDETMIVDPTLPDPTPRLPVYERFVFNGQVGWDENDWPVIKRGSAWRLGADRWHLLDEKKSKMITKMPQRAKPAAPLAASRTSSATTSATTTATTSPTTQPLGEPLLVDKDGNRYFDGLETLRVIDRAGKEIEWNLPASATGSMDSPVLIRTSDGLLFLFNEPGRVLRIKRTPDTAEPFEVEASFTKRIPNQDHPTRIWLDPAGRIVMAVENELAIMFPAGRIPREISELMLQRD